METVAHPPADVELHLLTDWSDPARRTRTGRAAILSVLLHIGAVVFLMAVPETLMQPAPRPVETVVTPLIEPLTPLTQKDVNTGKVSKEFNATDLRPHPRLQMPAAPPPAPEPPAPRRAALPPPPPIALPEPPRVDVPNETPKLTLPVQPPQIQPEEQKPRPGFEDVTAPKTVAPEQRVLQIPGPGNVLRGAGRGPGIMEPGATASGAELPQLLSDPQGVDFKPYLAQVLARVKSYWFSIMPDAVRLGRTGRVSVQFAIQRDGTVRKAVYAEQTGIAVLDRAAIEAISGANPFPSLPPQYRGGEIRVQINFAYNVPKQ
ncbi:MAG TPA: TonB family protein [Bryobacteraceae bacterium]|nr:TonB family protein [Bryobacteraceae bacterium]